jgi:four helix bundle protein
MTPSSNISLPSVSTAEESDDGGRYASLRSQLFRAATSIPANIAEGRRQESEKEFARFLRYTLNSSSELEYHLILAHDTKAISERDFRSLVTQTIRVRKMLYALLKCLSGTDRTSPAPARAHKPARPEPTADPPTALGR